MIYRVVFTQRASDELAGAAKWWMRHRSHEQAAKWYSGFSDAIASLVDSPERCPLAAENGVVPYEIREMHYGLGARATHRAVFVIRPDMVLILTIRHASQPELTDADFPGT